MGHVQLGGQVRVQDRSLLLLLPHQLQDQLQLQQPANDAERRHGGDDGRKAVGSENPQKQVQPPDRNCSLDTLHNFQTVKIYILYKINVLPEKKKKKKKKKSTRVDTTA